MSFVILVSGFYSLRRFYLKSQSLTFLPDLEWRDYPAMLKILRESLQRIEMFLSSLWSTNVKVTSNQLTTECNAVLNKWAKWYSTWSLSLQLTGITGDCGLSLSQVSAKEKSIWHTLIRFLQQTIGELEIRALIHVPNVILHYTVTQIPVLHLLYKTVCWKNSLCSRRKRQWQDT